MLPKLIWVLLPIFLYAVILAVLVWRGRMPSRLALNIQTSLLLMAYLLTTASLGIFWVANQQLPAFDWHYLFGYSTLLLISIHLSFNLPTIWRWLKGKITGKNGPPQKPTSEQQRNGAATVTKALALCAALAAVFFLGTRHSSAPPDLHWNTDSATAGPVEAVLRYHEFSSESRSSVFRRAPSIEWGAPPAAFKHYPDRPHIALANRNTGERGLSQTLRAPLPRTQNLRLAELGELLHLAAGITAWRGDTAYRAAPSAGALFPSELYLLVRAIEGLPAGLYHYDAEHHRLSLLDSTSSASSLGVPTAGSADAIVLLSSIFRRTGFKYRDRAYRYAMADAGHLLENLRLAGHKAGLQAQPLAQFDEASAAKALALDGVEEAVLAMLALRSAAGTPPAWQPALLEGYRPAAAPPDSAIGVTGMVHQASSLRLLPEAIAPAAIALPVPAASAAGVYHSITNRRSQRRFLAAPVALATLSSILADMAQPPQLSGAIETHLVVNRVSGLNPGVYRYLPQHALQRVRAGEFGTQTQAAALAQDVIGDAAVVLILSGQRERILAQGARGYRHAYLEAGMLSERWLLSATAHKLAACPVGAFYDDEAATLIGADSQTQWVLHFAALGLAAP